MENGFGFVAGFGCLLVGAIIGSAGLLVKQLPKMNYLARPLAVVLAAITPMLIMYSQPWPPGDIYAWGLYTVTPAAAGAFIPFIVADGAGWWALLVLPVQILVCGFAIGILVNTMDGLGYYISYWRTQSIYYGADGYGQIRDALEQEIAATVIYLAVTLLLLTFPFPTLRYLQKRDFF